MKQRLESKADGIGAGLVGGQYLRWWLMLFALLVFVGRAHAELVITISEGVDAALPVAVVPFKERGVMPEGDRISDIVSADLTMSGEFSTLSPTKMLSLPSRGDEVFYRDWRLLGQRYLVIGEVNRVGDRLDSRFEVFDVSTQERILGETQSAPVSSVRALAHYISDKVYEAITGVPGAFSTRLAYVTLESNNGKPLYKLQVSDVDGKRARVRLESEEPILSPAWSPDGRKLAYVSFETGKPVVYIHELASGQRIPIASFRGLNSAPAWSPDGRSLLLTLSKDGNAEIYKMDIASRSLTRLTNHWSIDTEGSWAADGRGIFFNSDRSGGPQVYYKESEGAEPRRITFGSNYNARPRTSEDGKFVFYVHRRDGVDHIAKTNLETGEETILTRTQQDESISLAPNGRLLIYATKLGGKSVLTVITSDGGSSYTLPATEGDVREPAWSPVIR